MFHGRPTEADATRADTGGHGPSHGHTERLTNRLTERLTSVSQTVTQSVSQTVTHAVSQTSPHLSRDTTARPAASHVTAMHRRVCRHVIVMDHGRHGRVVW